MEDLEESGLVERAGRTTTVPEGVRVLPVLSDAAADRILADVDGWPYPVQQVDGPGEATAIGAGSAGTFDVEMTETPAEAEALRSAIEAGRLQAAQEAAAVCNLCPAGALEHAAGALPRLTDQRRSA